MLFEHEIHPNWGTHKFDFARGEVRSFLVSNVLYWLENFHVDGIRMDGVSSMLYLNFGIDDPGQRSSTSTVPRKTWTPARLSARSTALWRRTTPT